MVKTYCNVKKWGKDLLVTGYEDGQRYSERIKFEPTLYLPSVENTGFKTIFGNSVAPMNFTTMKEAQEFLARYDDVSNFDVFGVKNFQYEYIANNYPNEIQYNFNDLRTFYLDIETYSGNEFPDAKTAKEKITAITVYDSRDKKFHVFGESGRYTPHRPDVVWYPADNEPIMLNDFVDFWSNNYPDVVTGWYSRAYDIPYIVHRIKRILGEATCNKLSPWGIVWPSTTSAKRFGKTEKIESYEFYGIAELDYMDLYQKYQGAEESYALGFVAEKILGDAKLEFEGSLHNLYTNDYQKYVEYNVQDVALIPRIEEVKRFLELIVQISYLGKVATFNDALGSVKWWEVAIYNHLKTKNIIAPVKKSGAGDKDDQFEGAFVVEPKTGMFEWVMTYDVQSLYPSLIRTVNIGPETLIRPEHLPDELLILSSEATLEKLINKSLDLSVLQKYNVSMSANGKFYKKDKQSFFSELMEKIFETRIQYKGFVKDNKKLYDKTGDKAYLDLSQQYDIKQQALKIILNSAFGCIGNQYFQYYSVDNAEAITISGRQANISVAKRLNHFFNDTLQTVDVDRCLGGDTDSTFFELKDMVKKYMPEEKDIFKVCDFLNAFSIKKTEPMIVDIFNDIHDYMNHYSKNLKMVRDVIANKAIITAKKKYVMNVLDSEGKRYSEPEMKIKGIEVVKSSTPKYCRKQLSQILSIMINEDEDALVDYIRKCKADFKLQAPDIIGLPTGINGLENYFDDNNNKMTKSVPMHVRAGNNYNKTLKAKNLQKEYEAIQSGNKIKYVFLRMPNPVHDDVIGFPEKLPKELNLETYIDYNRQFEKALLAPINLIAKAINWRTEKPSKTLKDRFK